MVDNIANRSGIVKDQREWPLFLVRRNSVECLPSGALREFRVCETFIGAIIYDVWAEENTKVTELLLLTRVGSDGSSWFAIVIN